MQYTSTYWAWLAGIIDGEGSLSVFKTKSAQYFHYKPSLQIGMSDTEAIVKAADMLDSPVYLHRTTKKRKDMFQVSGQGRNLGTILLRLLPWLRTKRPQAELLLSFLRNCPSQKGKALSVEQVALQEGYRLASISANC